MAIFNSYVKLPEGMWWYVMIISDMIDMWWWFAAWTEKAFDANV